MDWIVIPFAAACFFAGIIVWALAMNFVRGFRSRSSWRRTTGRIQTFGVNYGKAEITYDYDVAGETLKGHAFVPGPLARRSADLTVKKEVYLQPDGSLKFPPGAEVPVFYDPINPSDAALVPGMQPGFWKSAGLWAAVMAVVLFAFAHRGWVESHWVRAIGPGAILAGSLVIYFFGIKNLIRIRHSHSFPATNGKLLTAEAVYTQGSESGGGYALEIQFEYEVGGRRFCSRQLTAISASVLRNSPEKIQAQIDRLEAEPKLTVYYDPRAPWDGFLRHGPLWGSIAPALMGLAFVALGIFLFFHAA